MPPIWIIRLSKSIGYFIIAITGYFYIFQLLTLSLEKVTSIALTAFATIASLSAICYTAFPCLTSDEERRLMKYAAEKFFHSSLLIIQTLFLKFALEGVLSMSGIKNIVWLKTPIEIVFELIILLISLVSVLFSAFGYDVLNKYLWTEYEKSKGIPKSKQ